MAKQKTGPKKKWGAYLVYSFRKAQAAYHSPLAMLMESLALCNYKNVQAEELDAFKVELNKKIKQVRTKNKNKKHKSKKPISKGGKCYTEFQKWARQHGMTYTPEFYKTVWEPSWLKGKEPIWKDPAIQSAPSEQSVTPVQPVQPQKTQTQIEYELNVAMSQADQETERPHAWAQGKK